MPVDPTGRGVRTWLGADLRAKTRVPLPAGTEITPELPGGGGFGPPRQRDPARVLADVVDGYVSLERARADYGVAIDPERMIVLEEETAALRRCEQPSAADGT